MLKRHLWLKLLVLCALAAWPLADGAQAQDDGGDPPVETPDDGTTDDGTTDDGTTDDGTTDDGTTDDGTTDDGTTDDGTTDDGTTDDGTTDDGTTDDGTTDDGTTDDDDDTGLKVVPPRGKVKVGSDRQFRAAGGPSQGLSWILVDASDASAARLDDQGRLTAEAGGWAIVGLEDDDTMELVASTDTIWLFGGPTRLGRRGGKAFAADDTLALVNFPANASSRAVTVLLEKRGLSELPEQARGRGTAVSLFEFDVTDADTGEDVGGTEGFEEEVGLTLTYDDELIPEGVDEEDLTVATFDEAEEVWEEVLEEAVIEHDTENNTITVGTTHASLWAVMDGESVAPPATAVKTTSWGTLKHSLE